MRRLCLILLCGLVAVPAAVAASRATGDGVLELRTVNGAVTVNGGRGVLYGQMDKGRLTVTDPLPGDGQIFVSGAERTRAGLDDNQKIYIGTDIHFRITGGRYRLQFVGSGIDFTAIGTGTAWLTGNATSDETGDYALDDGKWTPVPWLKVGVPFGTPPIVAGGPIQSP
jgi:hypothetical protein